MPTLVERVWDLATRVGQEIKAVRSVMALDSAVVHRSGPETIAGPKTFGSPPVIPTGTELNHPVRRDDPALANARPPTAHTHVAADIAGLLRGPLTGLVPAGQTSPVIQHGRGTWIVLVQIRDTATQAWVPVANRPVSADAVELTFTTPPTSGQYSYLIWPLPPTPRSGFGRGPFGRMPFGGSL